MAKATAADGERSTSRRLRCMIRCCATIANVRAESLCRRLSADPPSNLAAWLVAPRQPALQQPTRDGERSLSELASPCGEGHDGAIRRFQTP